MKETALKIADLSKELILNPRAFWKLHSEMKENGELLKSEFLLPLLYTVAVSVFLGEFFRSEYFRIWVALLWVVREVLLFAVIYFMGIFGTNYLIKHFGYEEKTEELQVLVSYSMIPFMLISVITGFLPFFYFLDIFGIYSYYIFMMGGRRMLQFPKEKRDNLILKIIAVNWIIFEILSFTTGKLLELLD